MLGNNALPGRSKEKQKQVAGEVLFLLDADQGGLSLMAEGANSPQR